MIDIARRKKRKRERKKEKERRTIRFFIIVPESQ
jgi:hypothetical protein